MASSSLGAYRQVMPCHVSNNKRQNLYSIENNSELILKGFDQKLFCLFLVLKKVFLFEKSSITIKSLKAILNRRE